MTTDGFRRLHFRRVENLDTDNRIGMSYVQESFRLFRGLDALTDVLPP